MGLCSDWCGECYAFRRGRSGHGCSRSGKGRGPGWRRVKYIRRRVKPAADSAGGHPGVQLLDLDRCPALAEFLTAESWPDGAARKPGTVLIFFDDYRVKACLSDRDQGMVMFVTAEAISLVLNACEDALRAPEQDWRPSKSAQTRRSGKGA